MALKNKEIASMSKIDLSAKLLELQKELMKHNAQRATGTTAKSTGQIKASRKTIAKILTVMNSPKKEQKTAEVTKQGGKKQ